MRKKISLKALIFDSMYDDHKGIIANVRVFGGEFAAEDMHLVASADGLLFLKGSSSGRLYCGVYEARPHDCRAFTPIGCEDVDGGLRHTRKFEPGSPFKPRHNGEPPRGKRRR